MASIKLKPQSAMNQSTEDGHTKKLPAMVQFKMRRLKPKYIKENMMHYNVNHAAKARMPSKGIRKRWLKIVIPF